MVRYLQGGPRVVNIYRWQRVPERLVVWVDSDHAGCKTTRKSTSGGLLMCGRHCIKTWSSTQRIIATSSGEAEYYGMVRGGSIGLGIRSMMKDFGVDLRIRIKTENQNGTH